MKQTVLPQTSEGSLLGSLVGNVVHADAPRVFLVLLVAALVLLAFQYRSGGRLGVQPPLVIFATAALLHLPLAKFGWLFRYESYLMALGTLSLGVSSEEWPDNPARAKPVLGRRLPVLYTPLLRRSPVAGAVDSSLAGLATDQRHPDTSLAAAR